jgi:hypothetical protein
MDLPEGFLIGEEEGGRLCATFEEAIKAAAAGGTVIVRKEGEFEIEPVSIPAGKALTIRAAAGYQPIFLARNWRDSILESDGPLCLEGLEFRHPFADVPGEAAPILHCRGAPVFLANCRFVRATAEPRRGRQRFGAKPLVRFDDCLQVEVHGCEFYTMAGTDVAVHVTGSGQASSLRATNNLFVG